MCIRDSIQLGCHLFILFIHWTAAKNKSTWSVWGQKRVRFKFKPKAHPTSPAIAPERIVPVLGRIKPRHTRVCLLYLTIDCFSSFFSQPEALHPMPPTRMPRYGEDSSTLHTLNHAIRATLASAYRPQPRYINATHGYKAAPWPQATSCQLHPKSR